MKTKPTIIPLSKTKLIFIVVLSLFFFALGNWLIINSEVINSRFSNGFIIGIGLACILFFGATSLFGLIKLLSKKPGLQIDEQGITDNSSAIGVGFIAWDDILSVRTEHVMTSTFILIDVQNPKEYINRLSGFKRKLLIANHKKYNTPIAIACNTLKINCFELENTIKKGLE